MCSKQVGCVRDKRGIRYVENVNKLATFCFDFIQTRLTQPHFPQQLTYVVPDSLSLSPQKLRKKIIIKITETMVGGSTK